MKGKLRFMWRATLALVLVLSLGVVMTVPVVAAALATPTLVLSSYVAAGEDVQHTISFDLGVSLGISDTITLTFDTDYVSPATVADDEVTIDGAGILGAAVGITVGTDVWVITLAAPISTATNPVVVVITSAAHLDNPAAGDYTLSVATTAETATSTASYTIIALPVVGSVGPAAGNVDDTMWVEVGGSGFTGDDETNVSTTTLDFGGGITVDSTKFISATEIDCQITITAAGAARYVIPTSTAGEGTNATADFDPNIAGTAQVDVWEAYDLTASPFVTGSLIFDETTTTIAAAETACDATETVVVHADTYVESLVIDETITLLALSGADSTIIDGGSNVLIVSVTAIATVDGFTIQGDATTAGQMGILVNGSTVSAFAIQNNKFVDVAFHNIKVWSNAGAITDGLIDTNTLTGLDSAAKGAAILVESSSNAIEGVTISDNTISTFNGVDPNEWPGIQVSGNSGAAITDIAITGNTISDGATGIKIWGGVTDLTGVYAIANNTITGQTEAGVSADDGGVSWPVFDVQNNIITGNKYGIELGGSTSSHLIKYNDISGNSAYGLLVPTSDNGTVNAAYNWWGDISGPSDGSLLTAEAWWANKVSDALGSGDAMSWYVDTWDPWLTESKVLTVSDGIAYFGSTMTLEPGWNTLSVPLELKDSANTIAEIAALGDFLTDTNWEIAYQYNPALPGWENIGTSAIELVPGRGYYIKILGTADVSFPVLYSGQLGLPTYGLTTAGWNLIGSMFGIDKAAGTATPSVGDYGICGQPTGGAAYYGTPENAADHPDIESWETVQTALDSIVDNASVVVSPTVPGQELVWGSTAATDSHYMIVGEAYWVFMEATDTLAGFEVTPIYWVDLP